MILDVGACCAYISSKLQKGGWSGCAMVPGKLPVPGRPTI